jgi:hypothetical protein
MWAVSDLPAYTVDRDARRKPEKKSKYSLGRNRSNSSATLLLPHSPSHSRRDSDSIRGLLEPAIDGPPSPETIRQLSNQMRQSSERDKHQSHQSNHTTTSSGSSSLLSLASADRPSWENALDGLNLSRKSSGRSATNVMPSRERPESVQIFSKSLFSRRGKLKRESSAPTSSGSSSLYSADGATDGMSMLAPTSAPAPSAPVRDSVVPAFFNRRRTATLDNVDENPRRRLQISGPYNFQHVAHTQKDNLPDLQRGDRVALASEFSQLRSSQIPASGTLKGIRADDLHFADFSSDFLPLPEETEQELADEPYARKALDLPPSMAPKQLSPPRRIMKHSKSQEQLRVPPPRPPRSPIDPAMGLIPTPPVPPPRISSRASIRPDGIDSLGAIVLDRPQTSSGFRHAQSFPLTPETTSPPATSHGYFPGPDMNTIPEHAHARTPSFPDDSNWPLPSASSPMYDAALPDVPEEDENVAALRRSRISIASNSSLRGSQSVPMLRPLSVPPKDENPRRPASNSSDTLGRFDLLAAQRALKAALIDGSRCQSLARESWEDDIDYCYEHAAEADCDFAWDRPSLDLSRDCDSTTPVEDQFRTCEGSPAMLTPGQFDVPALSPVSQVSCATAHEAITPTLALPKTSNFSLPRSEPPSSLQLLHVRKPSDASSFKESHGFTLSPSLLIPNDYQQQMLAAEADAREFAFHPFDEPLQFESSGLHTRYRTSASTTGTIESSHSGFEKHISAASSSTDFTRLSASTGSLDLESLAIKSEPFPLFEVPFRGETKGAMPTLPESEEAVPELMVPRMTRSSESNLIRLAAGEPNKRKDSIQARRQRARTTSLSTPPPPNQYALFPSAQLTGARI